MFNLKPWKKKSSGAKGESISGDEPHPLARLRSEMEGLFERFWQELPGLPGFMEGRRGWRFDVEDTDNEMIVRAETPGFAPDELDVQLRGNRLVIKAEHKEEINQAGTQTYQYGSFHRSVSLPEGVETEKIDAKYQNGVLEIHIPKVEQAQSKTISVTTR